MKITPFTRRTLMLLGTALLAADMASAKSYLIDFNSSRGYRGLDPASPDANGNTWNAVPHPVTGSSQLNGLVATDGTTSRIDVGFSSPFGTDSYNGPAGDTSTGAPDYLLDPSSVANTDIDSVALGDLGGSLAATFDFISTVSHTPAGQAAPVVDARFAIQGLDPELSYTLKFFGSRKFSTESTTIYEAFSDEKFEYLSAAASLAVCHPAVPGNHNRDQVAVLAEIRPSASGTIYVRMRGAGGQEGYLNAMQIIEGTRPVDARGILYVRLETPAASRAIVADSDLGPLTRLDLPATNLRGHWYLMTRADNTLVWIVNRVTGEALRAASDAGSVSSVLWDPDDPRQTWRVSTAGGVSRLRIEGTGATLTAGADGQAPRVGPDDPADTAQDWILPELPRGGLFPWTSYNEDNYTTLTAPGEVIRSAYRDGPVPLAAEAQKRGLILLNDFGTHVQWNATAPADAMTLRYSVADGTSGTITLRVTRSGSIIAKQKVPVTSAQAWVYFDSQGTELQSPGSRRTPAKRFNEARIKLETPLAAGDTIEFRRDSGDIMTWIDVVETETAELVPLPDAASYLVATDFGTAGNGTTNDTTALKNAVAAAAAQGKKLYLPPGTYRLEEEIILPPGFVLQGAGMWQTELVFSRTASSAYAGQALGGIKGSGSHTVVRDLYMKSAQSARSLGYHALKGFWGTGSLIENVWTEHFETGAWIADYSNDADIYTDGLVMRSCRLRNAFADGVNYASGTRNSVVENTHVRGCGDDGLATYAAGRTQNKPTTRNIQFRYNTIESVYRAGGIGIFGGEGHKIHHNIIRDQLAGPGLRLNTVFVYLNDVLEGYPFGSQLIQFYDNTLERTGNLTVFNEQAGAIELQTWYTNVENIRFTDIDIVTSRYEGIRFSRIGQVSSAGFDNILFTRINFSDTPFGTLVTAQASGESSFDNLTSAAGINNQSANFTVNGPPPPPPVIESFTPSGAVRGATVTVTGSYLGSTSLVQVGAQSALSYNIVNDNTLTFTVPPEAVDGRIRVTTTGGSAQSANVLVVPENNEAPVISLAPPGSVSLPEGAGLILGATVTDDGLPDPPANLTTTWSVVTSPPGAAVAFDDATRTDTGVTFSTAGNYLLRLTAYDNELTATADVAVAVGIPSAGSGQDIGSVGVAGRSDESGGTWTVQASGADIWESADGFHFRYAELTGDGFVQVRLLEQSNTDPWAKAGLMIRDSLTAGSAHALLVGTTANGLALQNRPVANQASLHEPLGAYSYPVWLRLVRSGTTISAYLSTDGVNWTASGTAVSPAMADPVYIGVAVTSHNNGVLSTARFDNLQGSGFGAPALDISAGADITAPAGETVNLLGSAPGSVSAEWQQASGPGTLAFAAAGNLSTTVTADTPGVYRVRLVADDGAVRTFDELVLNFEDSAKLPAVVTISNLARTYDGTAQQVAVATEPAGLDVEVTYNGSTEPPVDAGVYNVLAVVNDTTYRGSASATLVVAKAPAGVVLDSASVSATYDGTPKRSTATTSPPGLGVDFTYNGSASEPVNAGSYAVRASVNDPNYEGSADGSLNIDRAAANITLGNLAQTYDGAGKTASTLTTPPGLAVSITYDGTSSAPAAVGTYAVEAVIDDPNYQGAASGSLVVGKATAAVNFSNLTAVYDGTAKAPTVTTTPAGLTVELTYDGSPTTPTDLGTYNVNARISDANYEGLASASFVIDLEAPGVSGAALVDFGQTPTPVVGGVQWNNFTNATAGTVLTNLVTTNNVPTGYALAMSTVNAINSNWIPVNLWSSSNATALGAFNVQTAVTDGLFVQPSQGTRGVRISGLDTNKVYTLRLYGGRNATETRVTAYTVRGGNTNTGILTNSGTGIGVGNVDYNNRHVFSVTNAMPDSSGAIHVEYRQQQGSFGYLNALSIEQNPGPAITAGGTLSSLSSTYGSPSPAASFAVSATSLQAALTVIAPSGFEVSTNASTGFASSIVLGTTGDIASTTVYARITAITGAGTHSGNIVVSSPGASTRTVVIPASVVAPALLHNVTFNAPTSLTGDGTAKDFTATSSGVESFTYSYVGRDLTTYGPSDLAPSAPGLYTVTASPDANFTGTASHEFFITGPLAVDDNVTVAVTPQTASVAIPIASLLANDQRIDDSGNVVADDLTIMHLGLASGGSQPSLHGSDILLELLASASGTETFTYRVRDSNGSEATATVTVTKATTAAPPPDVSVYLPGHAIYDPVTGTTRVTHRLAGLPGEGVVFVYTPDLATPYRNHSIGGYAPVITSDADGIFQLTITEPGNHAAAWNSRMFFRASWPQAGP
jgi:hypothetical protein